MPPAQAEAIAKAIHDAVATAPPRLEVLEERVKHTATSAELSATTAQMNKLHGEATAGMNKLHGEATERMARMEGRMVKIESDLATIKWILSVFLAPFMVAIALGMLKLIFFP